MGLECWVGSLRVENLWLVSSDVGSEDVVGFGVRVECESFRTVRIAELRVNRAEPLRIGASAADVPRSSMEVGGGAGSKRAGK